MLTKRAFVGVLPAVLVAAMIGCGDTSPTGPAKDSGGKGSAAATGTVKDSSAGKAAAIDTSGLKELDEADRKLAEQQKVCPVSGNPLGSMGKPFKMTVKGRVVFLCCDGCKDEVDKDPDGILKKLDGLAGKK
jgi:Cu(I)/Ag(I) efflux system membrane fusion protein